MNIIEKNEARRNG